MKCHYEVLGIERDADEKAIKNCKILRLLLIYSEQRALDLI